MSTAIVSDAERRSSALTDDVPMETDEALYEWINGERVAMPPMSIRASSVAGRLHVMLNSFATPARLGESFILTLIGVPMPEDLDRNRRPDVCFVSAEKLASANPEDLDVNAWAVVPDLAVEVTSPTDRAEVQREKVQEYLRIGVLYVWVVYPKLRLIDVYGPGGAVRTFGPDGVVPGDPILPGLEISLDDLFRPIWPPAP